MKCQHLVADYQYATWHQCRACGAMVERPVVLVGSLAMPPSLHQYVTVGRAQEGQAK